MLLFKDNFFDFQNLNIRSTFLPEFMFKIYERVYVPIYLLFRL